MAEKPSDEWGQMTKHLGKKALEGKRAEEALGKRTRELDCLYAVLEMINRPGISLEERFKELAALIPRGWRYPEIACARVVFEGREYTTDGFEGAPWKQAADIIVHGNTAGAIEVYYREEKPDKDEGPFLKEERDLINAVARRISRYIERTRLREAFLVSEQKYRTIFETTGTATVIIEDGMKISLANREFEKLSGYPREEVDGAKSLTEFIARDDLERIREHHRARSIDPNAAPRNYTFKLIDKQGNTRDIFMAVAVIPGTNKSVASLLDTTELKRAQQEREILHKRLEDALTKVLGGFLPICANCKRIRDDSGAWEEVEAYIGDRTEAEFSHGICPECKKELYDDFLQGEK
ncbi:MAG: PAS domain S-box protein [Desulfobacterales bacterium]|nr:PAS domain S-box protein [Desulfobacterales bacterium]